MKTRYFFMFSALLLFSIHAVSQISKDQQLLNLLHKKTQTKRDSLGILYQSYFAEINSSEDSLKKDLFKKKIDSLDKLTEINNNEELLTDLQFVKDHPVSIVSLNALLYRIYRREGLGYCQEIASLYEALKPDLKKSKKGLELKEALFNLNNSSIGKSAPNFSVKDINGNELSLNTYRKNNYVLLDFWASWCAPCREDFSFLKEIYKTYHSKGFEIINISKDDNAEFWKKAIDHDGIGNWRHCSLFENKSRLDRLYFVNAIPVKILINKEGVIIGRWRGGGEENKKEIQKILNDIFAE